MAATRTRIAVWSDVSRPEVRLTEDSLLVA